MQIDQLINMGGLISAAPVPQEITWVRIDPDSGEELSDTFTIHVRKLAYEDQERMLMMAGAFDRLHDDDAETDSQQAPKKVSQKSINSALIATAVRLGETADQELTYEQASRLHHTLAGAMLDAISKVNPAPRKKKSGARRGNLARAGS